MGRTSKPSLLADSRKIKLLRVGYYQAPPVAAVIPHRIPKNSQLIELVTEGIVHFEEQGRRVTVGCGALFWHVGGEDTIHLTEPEAPYACLTLLFSVPPFARRLVPRLSILSDPERTRELSREMLRNYHDDSVDREHLGEYAHARFIWESRFGAIQQKGETRPPMIERALRFIETQFALPTVGVREVALSAGISEPHLHALFRQHLNQTPHQFLLTRRIQEAKWRLSGSTAEIKAIAAECGFLNIETFYRVFKKQVGLTPNEFRKKHRSPILAFQEIR